MIFDERFVATWPKIGHTSIILRLFFQSNIHIIKIDIAYLPPLITAYKTSILTRSCNIIEEDSLHFTTSSLCFTFGKAPVCILMITISTWIRGYIYRLSLTSPHITPHVKIHLNVTKGNVTHTTFIAILNAQTTIALCNDAVIEVYIIDRIHVLTPNFNST